MTKVSKNLEVQGYGMEEMTEREGYGRGKTVERERYGSTGQGQGGMKGKGTIEREAETTQSIKTKSWVFRYIHT